MSVIFRMNEIGKVTIYPYGITDGTRVVPCATEEQANKLLNKSMYTNYAVINSDTPSNKLLETLKGVRFDSYADAEAFINGGGYEEGIQARVEDLECVIAEMIGGE